MISRKTRTAIWIQIGLSKCTPGGAAGGGGGCVSGHVKLKFILFSRFFSGKPKKVEIQTKTRSIIYCAAMRAAKEWINIKWRRILPEEGIDYTYYISIVLLSELCRYIIYQQASIFID